MNYRDKENYGYGIGMPTRGSMWPCFARVAIAAVVLGVLAGALW